MKLVSIFVAGSVLAFSGLAAGSTPAGFSAKPQVELVKVAGDAPAQARIRFAVTVPTDVEVTILDKDGQTVRHLAAGVLGGQNPPPPPLKAGLAQDLAWDGKTDAGDLAAGGPMSVQVRLGLQAKLDGFVAEEKEWVGELRGLATDDKGNLYVYSSLVMVHRGDSRCLQVFDRAGKYLRTIMPMPADTPKARLLPFSTSEKLTLDPPGVPFSPRNYSGTWPQFYAWPMGYLLPRVGADGVLTFRSDYYLSIASLNADGGCAYDSFAREGFNKKLWTNSYEIRGQRCLVRSPDGRRFYLCGFGRAKGQNSTEFDPAWPLGRIYRMQAAPGDFFDKWIDLPDGDSPAEAGAAAFDPKGNLLVYNGGTKKVVVLDADGKQLGQFAATIELAGQPVGPRRLLCHRTSGEIYADYIGPKVGKAAGSPRKLIKYAPWDKGAAKIAEFDLPDYCQPYGTDGDCSSMALDDSAEPAIVWAGAAGRTYGTGADIRKASYLLRIEDQANRFVKTADLIDRCREGVICKTRLAVHPQTDTIVYNDGYVFLGGVNGRTGEKVKLPVEVGQDMAVGLDGNWYFQASDSCYTGPICRYDKDLKPVPVPGRKDSKDSPANMVGRVYSRIGAGYCTVGLAADQRGRVYSMQMWTWATYGVAVFGPDGKPEDPGRLRNDPKIKEGKNKFFSSVLLGDLGGEVGGIQLDWQGNVYVGKKVLPPDHKPPAGYENKNSGYLSGTGTVIKFGPAGGAIVEAKDQADKKGLPVSDWMAWGSILPQPRKMFAEGAEALYPGLGCMGGRFGDGCMCRQPMFQVDGWGRLFIPNALLNSVRVVDNAGNEVTRFGHYGNIDSRGPGADSLVKTPEVPLGWPEAVGVSNNYVYVADVLNRRIVRLKKVYAAEEICPLD